MDFKEAESEMLVLTNWISKKSRFLNCNLFVGWKGRRIKLEMKNKILITNIQRFSLHDGPGIRTTVFLKGCSLCCPWCSNPENLLPVPQPYIRDNLLGIYGKYYNVEELTKECMKDKAFYSGKTDNWSITTVEEMDLLPGGVTFSGGECLLQMERLVPVCERLHEQLVHIAVETCLFVPAQSLALALEHIDFFYVDVKILDAERAKEIEKGSLSLYLANFNMLMKSRKPVVIRVPVIGSYTDGKENRNRVKQLIGKYRKSVLKIELIKEHNLGESKYKSLGMAMDYHGVEDSFMEKYRAELSDLGLPVEVCKI